MGKFIANCEFWAGGAAKQVWIGLDFDVLPKTVRCIRINQPVHEGFDEGGMGVPESQNLGGCELEVERTSDSDSD